MNYINHRNQLDIQITNYARIMKLSTRLQVVKLSKEIANLSSRIDAIDQIPISEKLKEITFSFETIESKINLKTTIKKDMSTKKRNPPELCKPIQNEISDSRRRAMQLASEHVDRKPIKYLLKN